METRMYIDMQVTPAPSRLHIVNITNGKKFNQSLGGFWQFSFFVQGNYNTQQK